MTLTYINAEKLNSLLIEHGITQNEVCTHAKLTKPTMLRMLSGNYRIRSDITERVAELFDIAPNELIGNSPKPFARKVKLDKKKCRIALWNAGITHKAAAKALGCSVSLVSKQVEGVNHINIVKAEKLAELCKCTLNDLIL